MNDMVTTDLAALWSGIPLADVLGMTPLEASPGVASARLPANPVSAATDGRVDPLALLPFLDQVGSLPLMLEHGAPMATIDLAVAFVATPAPGDIVAEARSRSPDGGARLVTAEATDSAGTAVATASLWFSLGAPPGGGERPPHVARASSDRPLREALGLSVAEDARVLIAPDTRAAVGWTGLPALHGGAIAVALAMAAEARVAAEGRDDLRLAQLSVRFLRAARTFGGTAEARVDAIGRRTARLSATCVIAGEIVATAQALLLRT